MARYELMKLKKIAGGGQAEIYALDEGRVLRVMRNPDDAGLLQREMISMQALFRQGVHVPEVFGLTEADGRPALVMQRIDGVSMMEIIRREPFGMKRHAEKLAELQAGLSKCKAPEGAVSSVSMARHFLDNNAALTYEQKKFLKELIDGLPEGDSLLHGDFQPGNVLVSGGKSYLIDWVRASRGQVISDIAHTYILMKSVPRIPGVSVFRYFLMRLAGNALSRSYLNAVKKHFDFDEALFSKWMAVNAMERLCFGFPSEKKRLLGFIENCRTDRDNVKGWYKKI